MTFKEANNEIYNWIFEYGSVRQILLAINEKQRLEKNQQWQNR